MESDTPKALPLFPLKELGTMQMAELAKKINADGIVLLAFDSKGCWLAMSHGESAAYTAKELLRSCLGRNPPGVPGVLRCADDCSLWRTARENGVHLKDIDDGKAETTTRL